MKQILISIGLILLLSCQNNYTAQNRAFPTEQIKKPSRIQFIESEVIGGTSVMLFKVDSIEFVNVNGGGTLKLKQ